MLNNRKIFKYSIVIFIFIIIYLFINVRISHPEYPENWPKRINNINTCPDLKGKFINQAEVVGYSKSRHLSWFFSIPPDAPFFNRELGPIVQVELKKKHEDLYEVLFHYKNGINKKNDQEFRVNDEHRECSNGELVIARPPSTGTSHGSYGKWTEVTSISKTVDGSIVLKKSLTIKYLLFYFLPRYQSVTEWQLYRSYRH